ncbi:MAG: group III truncated hemoglobin [Kordiimonadaceae bacterium]|nr:group III truncated hemoglobin [Kordiimonadaceae bacterium]
MEQAINHNSNADRPLIHNFVEEFYSAVRQNAEIGPIFDTAIGDHWDTHIQTLTDFWMTVLFGERSFKGNPFLAHRQLAGLEDGHFDIWLGIFHATAKDMLHPALSDKAIDKSQRIASSLREGLFFKTPS